MLLLSQMIFRSITVLLHPKLQQRHELIAIANKMLQNTTFDMESYDAGYNLITLMERGGIRLSGIILPFRPITV